jgi:hypothetical protein
VCGVALQDLALSLGGAAAVAAHGGDEEGLGAQVAQAANDGAKGDGDVGDAAAAGGQGYRLTGADDAAKVQRVQDVTHRCGHVLDLGPLEALAQAHHSGVSHGHAPVLMRGTRSHSPLTTYRPGSSKRSIRDSIILRPLASIEALR